MTLWSTWGRRQGVISYFFSTILQMTKSIEVAFVVSYGWDNCDICNNEYDEWYMKGTNICYLFACLFVCIFVCIFVRLLMYWIICYLYRTTRWSVALIICIFVAIVWISKHILDDESSRGEMMINISILCNLSSRLWITLYSYGKCCLLEEQTECLEYSISMSITRWYILIILSYIIP